MEKNRLGRKVCTRRIDTCQGMIHSTYIPGIDVNENINIQFQEEMAKNAVPFGEQLEGMCASKNDFDTNSVRS